MPKTSKQAEWQRVRELLHGGKNVPEGLLRRHIADVKRGLMVQFKEKSALQQEAAKYRSELQKPIAKVVGLGKEEARAVAGLRRISERLAKRRQRRPWRRE